MASLSRMSKRVSGIVLISLLPLRRRVGVSHLWPGLDGIFTFESTKAN